MKDWTHDSGDIRNTLGHYGIDGVLLRTLNRLDCVVDRAAVNYAKYLKGEKKGRAHPGWLPVEGDGYDYGWPYTLSNQTHQKEE